MTNLQTLGSRDILGKTVTAFGTVENPLFLAKDVAEWIEHSNHRAMLDGIDSDEKIKLDPGVNIPYAGGDREQWFLTEAGLYEVLFLSRKPVAREFKQGVKKLLHDLRTGKAKIERPLSGDELILAAVTELQSRVSNLTQTVTNQQAQIEADKLKVLFSEAVSTSKSEILVGELAKILHQNGVNIGQNWLFERLRKDGYLCKTGSAYNMPTQRAMDLGLFRIKETTITHSDGHITVTKTPKVTGKGQIYFVNKFLGNNVSVA
jgi:anti-repressor protein